MKNINRLAATEQVNQITETIDGSVENVIFFSRESGFTVIELHMSDDIMTVAGEIGEVSEGEELTLTGSYSAHPKYGMQFRAVSCVRKLPSDISSVKKYLASGAIKGIGKKTAARLTEKFGIDVFDVIENEPDRLLEVEGITEKKAAVITEEYKKIYGIKNLTMFLSSFGVAPSAALSAWKVWGHYAVECINENPYCLCTKGIDLPFATAEDISEKLKLPKDNPNRIKSGITWCLRQHAAEGHTCCPAERLADLAVRLLGVDSGVVYNAIKMGVKEEIFDTAEFPDDDYVFLHEYFIAEHFIASRLAFASNIHTDYDYTQMIELEEAAVNIKYAERQRKAINFALTNGLMILTGGPGTGKTTALKAVISLMVQRGMNVFIAAPTGKAAKRISELTGFEAKTIHRLLEVTFDNAGQTKFVHDERNQLKCDAVVVDETSMMDVLLFEALLRALKPLCRIILVGDSDQLPSVGAGNVLKDLLDSGEITVSALTEIFRQASESAIVTNAHRIVKGEYPEFTNNNDFFFMQRLDTEECAQTVSELVAERLPKKYDISPLDDIQVLCPSRKGAVGVEAINRALQNVLNPDAPDKISVKSGYNTFRVGDKVMQMRNNYDIVWTQGKEKGMGIFNGEIGIIRSILKPDNAVKIDFDGKLSEYSFDELIQLELSYATTIHKSQGSEFTAVILPLLGGYEKLFYRNLLYTAVTRAKKLLIIVGSKNVVYKMVDNNLRTFRYTGLKRFITQKFNDTP
ncbi:MAG: ATP-dependent RecD-like DNA helicase [Ruminococcus sp.]|jgi:exodeoxyribonuclease V alpha subunit|nr:ATP-dependent RecD-like DNA helicase [Ruminococcus sp.]